MSTSKITVKDLSGKQVPFEYESSETVRSLKSKIKESNQFNTAESHFDLVYDGKVLEDDLTLAQEKVKDGVIFHLLSQLSTRSSPTTGHSPTSVSPTKPILGMDSYINTKVAKVDYSSTIFQQDGNKWDVRGFRGGDITIDQAKQMQAILIQDCKDTTVNITVPKVNRILVDRCTNLKLNFNNAISQLEIVNGNNIEVKCSGTAPTIQIDISQKVNLHFVSSAEGLTHMRFVNASCSEVFITIDDLGLQMQVPTSMLQDQLASRVQIKDGKYRLKSLQAEGMKKGGYLNLSLLDSSNAIPFVKPQ